MGAAIVYGASKFAGGYVPALSGIAPWMEWAGSTALAWFQSNLALSLTAIGGGLAAIKGFFTLLGSVRKQGEETKDAISEQVTAARSTFQSEVEAVKKDSEVAIGELKGEVTKLGAEKQTLSDDFNAYKLTAQDQLSGLKQDVAVKDERIKALEAQNSLLLSHFDAENNAIREKLAGTQGL